MSFSFGAAAAVLLLAAAAILLRRLILPFLAAFLLAALFNRPVLWLQRRNVPRWASSALLLLLLILGAGCGLWLIGSRILYEIGQLLLQLPILLGQATTPGGWLDNKFYAFLVAVPVWLQDFLQATLDRLVSQGLALPSRFYDWLASAGSRLIVSLPDLLLTLVTTLLAAFYCTVEYPTLCQWLKDLLPPRWSAGASRCLGHLKHAAGRWLAAQLRLMGVMFCLLTTGFLLLRIPYAFLAGFTVAVVDALPVFGSGTLLLPWALLSLARGERSLAAGLVLLYIAAWLLRSFLEPRLLGKQAGVSPLASLAAMYCGYRLIGVLGLILAPLLLILGVGFWRSLHTQEK